MRYVVQNLPDKKEAADFLAELRKKLEKLIGYLKEKYPKDLRIARLVNNFKPENNQRKCITSQFHNNL